MRERTAGATSLKTQPQPCEAYSPPSLKPRVVETEDGMSRFRSRSPNGYKGGVAPRFFSKVNLAGPVPEYAPHLGNCWIWTGALDRKGYGQFWYGERIQGAYVVGYRHVAGLPVPEGHELDHLCRVHACVRFDHLEPVTHRENSQRSPLMRLGNGRRKS